MYTILGATGTVGSKIAEILLKKGEEIRLVARTADKLLPSLTKKAKADMVYTGNAEAYAGDITDTEFLAHALEGSDAIFTLLPPNGKAEKFLAYADKVIESIAGAVEIAKVKNVVNLSSIGAELSENTGPILGLHRLEERLNRNKNLNVLHVRAAYFMENLLMNIDLIKAQGITDSAIRGDLKFPMIATRDIADFVAERLVKLDFPGLSVKPLLGQRDLSLIEATAVIGSRIGKPELKYIMFSYDEAEKAFLSAGFSADMSRQYIDMSKAFNEGRITGSLKRTKESTTTTSFEKFCDEVFVPLYLQKKAA